MEVKIVVFPFSTLNQATVVGKVFVEVDTSIVILTIPPRWEHVRASLALHPVQELYGLFREEATVKDEDLPADIQFTH